MRVHMTHTSLTAAHFDDQHRQYVSYYSVQPSRAAAVVLVVLHRVSKSLHLLIFLTIPSKINRF